MNSARLRATAFFGLILLSAASSGFEARGASAGAAGGDGNVTVFRGVHLLPMNREGVLKDRTVVVRGGRIQSIGADEEAVIPDGAVVIDAAGKFLLPGLMDLHVHIKEKSDLGLYLLHGITTIRNMHGTPRILRWRNAINEGLLLGPAIITASPVTTTDPNIKFQQVETPDQARAMVRQDVELGYDLVKVYDLNAELFTAIMDEARKQGIPVSGHYPVETLPASEVLGSGMRSLEHVDQVYNILTKQDPSDTALQATIRSMAEHQVALVTLLGRVRFNEALDKGEAYLAEYPDLVQYIGYRGVAEARESLAKMLEGDPQAHPYRFRNLEAVLDFVKRAHDGGVLVVPGTDSNSWLSVGGRALHDELDVLVRAGFTPFEALQAATQGGARLLGLEDRKGTLEPGKDADLLLLESNPLEDLGALHHPWGVMVRGEWLGPKELQNLRKSF